VNRRATLGFFVLAVTAAGCMFCFKLYSFMRTIKRDELAGFVNKPATAALPRRAKVSPVVGGAHVMDVLGSSSRALVRVPRAPKARGATYAALFGVLRRPRRELCVVERPRRPLRPR
jgi:hypothetical protein